MFFECGCGWKGKARMRFKSRVCALALAMGMSVVPAIPALARPIPDMQGHDDQHHDRDDRNDQWGHNKYYKMGMKDGEKDRHHNRRDEHHRRFKHDDDRRAYEAGYNSGYGR